MKTIILLSAAIILYFSSNAFTADQLEPAFLENGKTYSISYLLDRKTVSENHLPLLVTILAHGPESWYFIKRADGSINQFWVNFDSVATVQLSE